MGQLARLERCDGGVQSPWGGQVPCVEGQLECMELFCGMGNSLVKSLWVVIRGQASNGDVAVGVCYRHLIRVRKWT